MRRKKKNNFLTSKLGGNNARGTLCRVLLDMYIHGFGMCIVGYASADVVLARGTAAVHVDGYVLVPSRS